MAFCEIGSRFVKAWRAAKDMVLYQRSHYLIMLVLRLCCFRGFQGRSSGHTPDQPRHRMWESIFVWNLGVRGGGGIRPNRAEAALDAGRRRPAYLDRRRQLTPGVEVVSSRRAWNQSRGLDAGPTAGRPHVRALVRLIAGESPGSFSLHNA
jgi:hypothetical protein